MYCHVLLFIVIYCHLLSFIVIYCYLLSFIVIYTSSFIRFTISNSIWTIL